MEINKLLNDVGLDVGENWGVCGRLVKGKCQLVHMALPNLTKKSLMISLSR